MARISSSTRCVGACGPCHDASIQRIDTIRDESQAFTQSRGGVRILNSALFSAAKAFLAPSVSWYVRCRSLFHPLGPPPLSISDTYSFGARNGKTAAASAPCLQSISDVMIQSRRLFNLHSFLIEGITFWCLDRHRFSLKI